MRHYTLPCILAILLLLCAIPGCLDAGRLINPAPTQSQPVTPVVTDVAPPSLVPGPTQTLPPDYYITVDVQKQGQSGIPTVTAIFRGGTGQIFTAQLTVKVTRSDGKVITKTMDHPKVGDEIDIEGTRYDDRVEIVDLVSTGNSYRIYDQLMPYQSVN